MTTPIQTCLDELKAQRSQIDAAIDSLSKLHFFQSIGADAGIPRSLEEALPAPTEAPAGRPKGRRKATTPRRFPKKLRPLPETTKADGRPPGFFAIRMALKKCPETFTKLDAVKAGGWPKFDREIGSALGKLAKQGELVLHTKGGPHRPAVYRMAPAGKAPAPAAPGNGKPGAPPLEGRNNVSRACEALRNCLVLAGKPVGAGVVVNLMREHYPDQMRRPDAETAVRARLIEMAMDAQISRTGVGPDAVYSCAAGKAE